MADDSIVNTIDAFWKARLAGDKPAVRGFFAPEATYELVGGRAFADPETVGPTLAVAAVDRLVDAFFFHGRERHTVIVDGPMAAVVSKVAVSYHGGAPVETEVCDVWAFDAAGKATSLRQFVDTDLVRRMIEDRV